MIVCLNKKMRSALLLHTLYWDSPLRYGMFHLGAIFIGSRRDRFNEDLLRVSKGLNH